MSRLTNLTYLKNRAWLAARWEMNRAMFGYLKFSEQIDLHDYYALTDDLTDEVAIEHRAGMTLAHPSLPQEAGRALSKLRRSVSALAKVRARLAKQPPVAESAKRTRVSASNITVREVAKPKPDLRRLALAIVSAAEAEARGYKRKQDEPRGCSRRADK